MINVYLCSTKLNDMVKQFIAYYRVSTNKQGLGLDAQQIAVLNYIKGQDGSDLIAEYQEKESGKNNYRAELSKALDHCKKSGATLIIAKLDRLSRNVAFVFQLKEANINFIALDLPDFNSLTLAIFIGMAQHERELCSKRTKDALQALKAKGKQLGNPRVFTHNDIAKSIATRKMIAQDNENNIKAVAMIRQLINDNTSYTKIANILNASKFRTSRGAEFTPTAVRRLALRYSLR